VCAFNSEKYGLRLGWVVGVESYGRLMRCGLPFGSSGLLLLVQTVRAGTAKGPDTATQCACGSVTPSEGEETVVSRARAVSGSGYCLVQRRCLYSHALNANLATRTSAEFRKVREGLDWNGWRAP
jgi:hypothetical protein